MQGRSFSAPSQVPRVVLVLLENLAGLDLLVFLVQVVILDPLVSQDPLENKVRSLSAFTP